MNKEFKTNILKKTVDDFLNEVDFSKLNDSGSYTPSAFALKFMNFIKLVNGDIGEDNKTPVMHLAMLDKLATKERKTANLCARGTAKTTLFMEYLVLYLATFGELDNFGKVSGMLYISDSMDNGVKSARNSIEFRYNNSEFLQYWVPYAKFTENYLEFKNKSGHRLGIKMFGAKSGIRGTKIFNKRPVLAVMDDLVSDADSKSKSAMDAIKDTVYSGVAYALDPTRYKMILNGTPFNKTDIVYEAIESGVWQVNVWPICEKFPCSRKDFKGAWEDRFTYDYVKKQYDDAVKEGKLKSFRHELMLRITDEEDKLVRDTEILWKKRGPILSNKHNFNFYITTDFATSSKQTADFSVISVWAYTNNKEWVWVDGICERQTMDKTINSLFTFVEEYIPQGVGIETSGQQGGNIAWIMREMEDRNIYFNLAGKQGDPGIRPVIDKLARFNIIVPQFKMGKIFFPEELKSSAIIGEFLLEISLTTKDGIKGKDDCLDTVSMLQYMNPWVPEESESIDLNQDNEDVRDGWGQDLTLPDLEIDGPLQGYMV